MKRNATWAANALLFACLLFAGSLSAQGGGLNLQAEPAGDEGPMIEFETTTVELGTFAQGETVVLDIPFKSVGSDPLEVDRVKPSCACSTLEWTEEALPPGKSGNLHAEIDTGDMHELGEKTKYFVFFYNGNPGVERVTVKFTLVDKKDQDGDGVDEPG